MENSSWTMSLWLNGKQSNNGLKNYVQAGRRERNVNCILTLEEKLCTERIPMFYP